MKRLTKTAALFLAVLTLLGALVSCSSKEEAPEGMQAANVYGDDFRLYVPMTWTLNTGLGLAGAYADMQQQSSVSTVKYLQTEAMRAAMTTAGVTDAGARMTWFWENECLPAIREKALGKEIVPDGETPEDTVLGGLAAKQFRFRATVNGNEYCIRQVVTERQKSLNGATETSYYVLTFLTLNELYEQLSDAETQILDAFVFSDTPYDPKEYQKPATDKEAPAGMRLASNNDVAYRFYVPMDWHVTVDDQIFSAYDTEDRANVSVMPYLPKAGQTEYSVPMYFTESEEAMQLQFGEDYSYLGHEDATLGGRKAHRYRFSIQVGETLYQYCQVIGAYKSMIYCVTYTATDAVFAAHLNEFDQIVAAFTYR